MKVTSESQCAIFFLALNKAKKFRTNLKQGKILFLTYKIKIAWLYAMQILFPLHFDHHETQYQWIIKSFTGFRGDHWNTSPKWLEFFFFKSRDFEGHKIRYSYRDIDLDISFMELIYRFYIFL